MYVMLWYGMLCYVMLCYVMYVCMYVCMYVWARCEYEGFWGREKRVFFPKKRVCVCVCLFGARYLFTLVRKIGREKQVSLANSEASDWILT